MSCNSTIHPYNDIVRSIHRQLEAYNQQHPPQQDHDDHVPFEQNLVPTPPPPPTSSSTTTSTTTTTTTVHIPISMQLQPCMQRAIITHSISDALFLPIQLLVPTPSTTTTTDRKNCHSHGSSSGNGSSNDGTDGPTPDSVLWEIHPTGARNHHCTHHHHHHHQKEEQRGGVVVVQSSSSGRRGRDVIANHMGSVGTIGWVVRRPGCSFCQQQALTLSILTSICSQYFSIPVPSPPDLLPNTTVSDPLRDNVPMFQIFGIVKDTYDTDSIIDYQRIYFPFPIYIDPSYALYQALGDRKLSLRHILTSQQAWKSMVCQTYQSLLLFRKNTILRTTTTTATTTTNSAVPERKSSSSSPHARINRRKLPNVAMTTTTASVATGSNDNSNSSSSHNDHATVAVDIGTTTTTTAVTATTKSNNSSSDGIVQGGIIFFNARGTPVAMYPEETGQDLRIADILQTIHAMIQQQQEQQKVGG
jgi:AhpC/TSA antioxidant enzyme